MTVIATGPMVHRALEAAEEAERNGVSVEVIDPRTLQPLDEEAIVDVGEEDEPRVVTHEAMTRMGFGAEVAAVIQYQAFDWLDAPIERVGAKFAPLAVRAGDGAVRRPAAPRTCSRAIYRTVGRRMATELKLPRLGQGMESGTIVKWLKSEGDAVEKGEPLYELDTDKVTQEVEADAAGVLLKIAVAGGRGAGRPDGRGDRRAGRRGVDRRADRRRRAGERREAGRGAEARARARARARGVREQAEAADKWLRATNSVRRADQGVAARAADRAGARNRAFVRSRAPVPDGRIVAEDVERAEREPAACGSEPQPAVSGEVEVVPLTSIRRTIARRLTEAWQVPVFQLTIDVDMERARGAARAARRAQPATERSRRSRTSSRRSARAR